MDRVKKLTVLINNGDDLINRRTTVRDPEFNAWRTAVRSFLSEVYGRDSDQYKAFNSRLFAPSVRVLGDNHDDSIEFVRDMKSSVLELKSYLDDMTDDAQQASFNVDHSIGNNKIFVVHGHDSSLKAEIVRFLEKMDLDPIILSEQANQGSTIIEKLESNSDVSSAIILLTSDDLGREKNESKEKSRARQNVIFEAGFFIGRLGRKNIILIADSEIELPSDIAGMVYHSKDKWDMDVLRDLKAAGYDIDANKLIN